MQTKHKRVNLSRASSIMAAIENYAITRETFNAVGDVSKMPRNNSDELFTVCFAELITYLYGSRNMSRIRPHETTHSTLYNRLQKKRKLE